MYRLRRVKTKSGATAIQAVVKGGHQTKMVQHFGSGHSDREIEILEQVATSWLTTHNDQLDMFSSIKQQASPLVSLEHLSHLGSKPKLMYELISQIITLFGFDQVIDPLIADLVFMRLVQPTSKLMKL